MSRQFDWFNRVFMVREPRLGVVQPSQEVGWDRSGAVRLRYHRWLEPDARSFSVNVPPTLTAAAGTLTISSTAGIRHVAYEVNGNVAQHDELLGTAPTRHAVSLSALKARLGGASMTHVNAIDDAGNIGELDVTLP